MSVTVIGLGRETPPSPAMGYPLDRFATPEFSYVLISPVAEPIETRRMREGIGEVFNYDVELSDRSVQGTTLILPDDLSTRTIVALNLPWVVKPEVMRGVCRDLAGLGIASVVFALEGTRPHPEATRQEIEQQLHSISIAKTGYTHHRALDAILPKHSQLDSDRVVPAGASKGAAESYAMGNRKYAGKRKVPHIESVTPAPLRPYTPADVIRLIGLLPGEVSVASQYVLKRMIHPDFWVRERRTLGFGSHFLQSVIHTTGTLFNGDPGANFRAINPRTHVHVDIHGGDIGCTPLEWHEEAIGRAKASKQATGRSNTSANFLERLKHMHIPMRLPFMVARIAMYMAQSQGGKYPNRVDYEQVRKAQPIENVLSVPVTKIPTYLERSTAA